MLILGVTPDFADLSPDVTALDNSEVMISQVWPGDTDSRRAVKGDWTDMPFEDGMFDLVVGDGSLTLLPYPDGVGQVLAEARRVTRPDGTVILRSFLAPDVPASDDALIHYAHGLKGHAIDALRWRFAVHAAESSPNIIADDAWRAFTRLFPDHRDLLAQNGWDETDFQRVALYRDGKMAMNFPTVAQLTKIAARHFDRVSFHDSGNYPMSELCPFVFMQGTAT